MKFIPNILSIVAPQVPFTLLIAYFVRLVGQRALGYIHDRSNPTAARAANSWSLLNSIASDPVLSWRSVLLPGRLMRKLDEDG